MLWKKKYRLFNNNQLEEIVKKDWNAYREYTPKKVMAKFNEIYLIL